MNYSELRLLAVLALAFCITSHATPDKPRQIRTATVNGIKWSFAVENGSAIITSGEKEKPAIEAWTEGDIVIPTMLGGFTVKEIGDNAFRGCGAITSLKLPDGVNRIGNDAFHECHSIRALEFPANVTAIGIGACSSMKNLETVRVLGKVPVYSGHVFARCGKLEHLDIGQGVERIIGHLCLGCGSLKQIVFPQTLRLIDSSMYSNGPFSGCSSLQEVYFLGPPPEIKNFGSSLDGKIRYTKKNELQWTRWLKAKQIVGAEPFNPADLRLVTESSALAVVPVPKVVPASQQFFQDPPVADNHAADAANAEADPFEKAEKDVATTPPPPVAYKPLELDPMPVADAYRELDIHSYKCRILLNDFTLAVTNANKEAASKRIRLRRTVKDNLQQLFEKATATGNLDMALALKTALDTADGEIKGDAVAVERAREYRDNQNVAIDNALKTAGIKAAKALYSSIDLQKQETTKKGDLDTARKLANFQQKVQNWARETNGAVAKPGASAQPSQPVARRPAAQPSRPATPVREIKKIEPVAKTYTIHGNDLKGTVIGQVKAGDVIVCQYIDGKWSSFADAPRLNPDKDVDYFADAALVKLDGEGYVLAKIPTGTKDTPFEFHVEEDDAGKVGLRKLRFHNNKVPGFGSVRYSVKIIPAGAKR